MIWNGWALEDELHEAFQEVMWKPWLTVDRGGIIDREAFIAEIVDVMHFLGNLLLCVAPVNREVWADDLVAEAVNTDKLASELWAAYQSKVEKNLQRQREGYDGKSDKCPDCQRELVEHTDQIFVGFSDGDDTYVPGRSYLICPVHGAVHNA